MVRTQTALYKQYMENPEFRAQLNSQIFRLTFMQDAGTRDA